MNDMSSVIVPKSDQINAEDFLAGPRTFTIEGVAISPGTEQPVSIKLIGEDRVWRPCKSMSRVLVAAWGPDASAYRGRSVTLYRDPKVKWGGMEVGGIRISHMTNLERDMALNLTATKGKRAPHLVKMLETPKQEDAAAEWSKGFIESVNKVPVIDALESMLLRGEKHLASLEKKRPELHAECMHAVSLKRESFGAVEHQEGRTDEQHGDQFGGDEGDAS